MNARINKAEVTCYDVAVVGGGLAGLTAAIYAARGGKSVVVLERSEALGGRARSFEHEGTVFNLGGHALYQKSEAAPIFKELGVTYTGTIPSPNGNLAMYQEKLNFLPGGFLSMLRTRLITPKQKLALMPIMIAMATAKTKPLYNVSLRMWVEGKTNDPILRDLLYGIFRITNYANAPDLQSAGAALEQVQKALRGNVKYVDGGWQSLVDSLAQRAEDAGVHVITGARVSRVTTTNGRVTGVALQDGSSIQASHVILTTPPRTSASFVESDAHAYLNAWADKLKPSKAACLDLALTHLPDPKVQFVLGLDEPYYLSVHTRYAKLGEPSQVMLHTLKYLPPDHSQSTEELRQELESYLDRFQPGWRELTLHQQFLPSMIVSHAIVTTTMHGPMGRPSPEVPGTRGLWLAGDWVQSNGMLADAAVASGKQAAFKVLEQSPVHVA